MIMVAGLALALTSATAADQGKNKGSQQKKGDGTCVSKSLLRSILHKSLPSTEVAKVMVVVKVM
jgi:hypothetical protein